jgi:hypothetical protein
VARVDPTRGVRLRHQSDHVALALREPLTLPMLIHTGRSICIRIRLTPSGRMSTRSLRPRPHRSRLRLPVTGRFVAAASP